MQVQLRFQLRNLRIPLANGGNSLLENLSSVLRTLSLFNSNVPTLSVKFPRSTLFVPVTLIAVAHSSARFLRPAEELRHLFFEFPLDQTLQAPRGVSPLIPPIGT